MKKFLAAGLTYLLISGFVPLAASAAVSTGHIGEDSLGYNLTYPIVEIENNKSEKLINKDIEAQVNDLKEQVENKVLSKSGMTYYEKYEDDNIVSLLFYVNKNKRFTNNNVLSGYTITYDKHDGSRVPMSRYLSITLAQLQDALNHSRAYAVDGLDNGVNLDKPIPYVSDNYFICSDGSIGLLYQPGDLMDTAAGPCKIIVSPETIHEVNSVNMTKAIHEKATHVN